MNQNEYIPAHHTQTIIIMHVCKSMMDFSCIWVFQNILFIPSFFPQIKLHFFIIKLQLNFIHPLHTHAKTVILSYGHTCITTFSYNSCHMMPTFGLTCDGLCQAVLVRIRQKCDL